MIYNTYDVIVVGAGHAGIEASLAASRMGAKTLMLTLNLDHIGQMSCNPAIGGIGKGHLVKEIDALGGEMARAIDETGIQFRMLNTKKGPAVRASRAQADKALYRQQMKRVLENCPNLALRQGSVERLLVEGGEAKGVETQIGEIFYGRRVILTTGTFLKGLIHVGDRNYSAGRAGDFAVQGLSDSLNELGFKVGRLKTGTCPRLDGRTIDYARLQAQYGDDPPIPFSFSTEKISQRQIPCHITYTNSRTHEIIKSAIHRSPMYSGIIKSRGPRYCPSIEDKVVRFADKERHQIFLEPEGADTVEVYPNGLSTSLPLDVQIEMVRSIQGLERAEIMRPGYAIEYDYVEPTQLYPSLETKLIKGLYHAGQINGTTGYEEAAAQGLMAGINAVLSLRGKEPTILARDKAYIGVLIDDLVTKGTEEPYRMFTSRVEYRLIVREDNADIRLAKYGHAFGLLSDGEYGQVIDQYETVERHIEHLRHVKRDGKSLYDLLKRPEVTYDTIRAYDDSFKDCSASTASHIEYAIKYEGFISRQMKEVEKFRHIEYIRIPDGFDFEAVPGLSKEVREKFKRFTPATLGQANRISGVTPASIALMMVYLKKYKQGERNENRK